MDSLSARANALRVKIGCIQGCSTMQLVSRTAEVLSAVNDLVNIVSDLAGAYETLNEEVRQWRQRNASR